MVYFTKRKFSALSAHELLFLRNENTSDKGRYVIEFAYREKLTRGKDTSLPAEAAAWHTFIPIRDVDVNIKILPHGRSANNGNN